MKHLSNKKRLIAGGLIVGIVLILGVGLKFKTVGKSDIDHCSETKTECRSKRWVRYESHKGTALDARHGQYMDDLIERWTQRKFTDDELSEIFTQYLEKQNISITTAGVLSGRRCLFETEADIPDYAKQLAASQGLYDFAGVYSDGELDESGKQICYYWEVRIQ